MFDNNHSLLLYLRLSKFFKAELSCQQQLRMLQLRQDDLAEILAGMDLSSNECDKLEYRQFFELSGTDAEELEAKDLIAKVSMDAFHNYAQVMPNFTVSQINHCIDDEVTFCLLNLLVLFNVDGGAGGALENRSYCEEVQVTSLKCAEFNYRIKVLITFFPKASRVLPPVPLSPVQVLGGQVAEEVRCGAKDRVALLRAQRDHRGRSRAAKPIRGKAVFTRETFTFFQFYTNRALTKK